MATIRAVSVRRLNALFQRAVEPVFVLDSERRLVYVNRAWEELTGRDLESVRGLECLPHGPSRDGDLDGLGGSFCPPPEVLEGRPAGASTLIVHPGGGRHWRRAEFWPLHDGRGRLVGLLGLLRDRNAPPHAPESGSQRLRAELLEVRERLIAQHGSDALIGDGPAHQRLLEQVATAAAREAPALILGEPGTGRRLVARIIHAMGRNPQAPLVPFDAEALPPEVLDRELFGERAAQGANSTPARLALPEGSTLLIGDIAELPRDLQARLAEAVAHAHQPSGAASPRPIRLLATTAVAPDLALREGRLREDLYYALTGLVIRLAPLRERLDALPVLAQHFLEQTNLREQRRRLGFTVEALDALRGYDWPGNLRELARVVEAAHARASADLIDVSDLPAGVRGHLASAYAPPPLPPPVTPMDPILEQVERRLIEQALVRARQNKSKAAELLEISRPRLYRRIKELSIPDVPEAAEDPPAPTPGA